MLLLRLHLGYFCQYLALLKISRLVPKRVTSRVRSRVTCRVTSRVTSRVSSRVTSRVTFKVISRVTCTVVLQVESRVELLIGQARHGFKIDFIKTSITSRISCRVD